MISEFCLPANSALGGGLRCLQSRYTHVYAHSTDLQPLSSPIHAPHDEETTGLFMRLHGKDLRSNKVDLQGVWRFLEWDTRIPRLPCFSRTFTIMDA